MEENKSGVVNDPYDEIKKEILDAINAQFYDMKYSWYDESDIGNEIGVAIGRSRHLFPSFDKEAFIEGIRHGLSLEDGTH